MSSRPDAVVSSGFAATGPLPPEPVSSAVIIGDGGDGSGADHYDDDPVVRTIDVFISPELSETIRLLQFPIQPAASNISQNQRHNNRDRQSDTPAEARFRPKHNMLELELPIPSAAQAGQRQLPDKMCLSQRTFRSNAVAPVTHMALAKLNRDGTRLNVVPIKKHVFQMRPSFDHLHDEDEFEDGATAVANAAAAEESRRGGKGGGPRPIMYQKKETERSANARKNSYAYKRASEEGEPWIELDVHGSGGQWSDLRKDHMYKVKCKDRENELKLAKTKGSKHEGGDDGGYVKSLNYLDSHALGRGSGDGFLEDLSNWTPSSLTAGDISAIREGTVNIGDDDNADMMAEDDAPVASDAERATAELASKLAVLLQTGNGTMIPYRVLRSRFDRDNVPDEMLTIALSSCAVLVRGNFALKSTLAKFLTASGGGGEGRKRIMRELRDLILLLLNMHGRVQRERLALAYSSKGEADFGYDAITTDMITFVLQTVAKKSNDHWEAKVKDDERFAANFPEVAACHGVYWIKKKDMLADLIDLYENAEIDEWQEDGLGMVC